MKIAGLVAGAIVVGVALCVALVAWIAYLFSVHVPEIIEDPSNMGSWAWVIVGAMFTMSGAVGSTGLKK